MLSLEGSAPDVLRNSPHQSAPSCSRHPVRHIAFNSHSLITANVPYERVVRSADLDNFTTHRRSVGWVGWAGVQKRPGSLILG